MEQILPMENKHDKALKHFKGRKTAALAYIGLVKELGNFAILLGHRKYDFGTVQKNSFGITWSQHLSGIGFVADSIIPRTGAILLSRKALYPTRCQYFQVISFIFVVGKLSEDLSCVLS